MRITELAIGKQNGPCEETTVDYTEPPAIFTTRWGPMLPNTLYVTDSLGNNITASVLVGWDYAENKLIFDTLKLSRSPEVTIRYTFDDVRFADL